MSVVEISRTQDENARQYRFGHFFALVVALLGLAYGLNLRSSIINATTTYNNVEVGIQIDYPSEWLIDFDGNYVFRVRDTSRTGYKTNLQISIRPTGPDVTERNILDNLNIQRPRTLNAYNFQAIQPYTLPDGTSASAMRYSFVDTKTNKFLESTPDVVFGIDILVPRGEQTLIITFRSSAETFEEDLATFNRMLRSLEF